MKALSEENDYVPQCNKKGNYHKKQCNNDGEYNNVTQKYREHDINCCVE